MAPRSMRILLVDDEPDILLLLQAMLRAPGWEVVGKATQGEAALRVATDIRPDVAIIDYMMPGMDGLQLAQRLKGMHSECDVLIFSAFDVKAEAVDSPHVDHFLEKGRIDELQALLTRIAKRKGLAGGDD